MDTPEHARRRHTDPLDASQEAAEGAVWASPCGPFQVASAIGEAPFGGNATHGSRGHTWRQAWPGGPCCQCGVSERVQLNRPRSRSNAHRHFTYGTCRRWRNPVLSTRPKSSRKAVEWRAREAQTRESCETVHHRSGVGASERNSCVVRHFKRATTPGRRLRLLPRQ